MNTAIVEQLKKISFFADMGERDLEQIAEITEEKSYGQGEVIVEERTAAERFFIICSGKIEITKKFEDGEEFLLAVHSDGDFFGEMALLDEGLRSATARALEPTTVLEITRPNFETLLYKAPVLAYHIMKELSSRLRETGALLVSFLQRRNRQLQQAYLHTLATVAETLGEADPASRRRQSRVARLAAALSRQLGLVEEEVRAVQVGTLVATLAGPGGEPIPALTGNTRALIERLLPVATTFVDLTAGPEHLSPEGALAAILKGGGETRSDRSARPSAQRGVPASGETRSDRSAPPPGDSAGFDPEVIGALEALLASGWRPDV